MNYKDLKLDCLYFKQEIPCTPHKEKGVSCVNCKVYTPIQKRILIIKLGALGDVIRTTPILKSLEEKYGTCHFTWLTLSPSIINNTSVHEVLAYTAENLVLLGMSSFDVLINLDKEKEACLLSANICAKEKFGFFQDEYGINGFNAAAKNKIVTGVNDDYSKSNTQSYLDEIFEICEIKFDYQEYEINFNSKLADKWRKNFKEITGGKKLVGLNTGCGPRWKTRLWPVAYWAELASQLEAQGYFVVLLGGPQEHEQNQQIAQETGVHYPGHYSLEEFIALCNSIDIVVTQVSMMMHIATALRKKMVLMNNIFNKHEFELYNRGIIVEPRSGCDCFYGVKCSRDISCMKDIKVRDVLHKLEELDQTFVKS